MHIFKLAVDSLWISQHVLQSHLSPPTSYPLSTLLTSPQQRKKSPSGTLVCHSVCYTILFDLHFFNCQCSLQRFICLGQDMRPLLFFPYWSLTVNPLEYLVVTLCHGHPAVLQNQHLHELLQFGRCSWRPSQSPWSGPERYQASSPATTTTRPAQLCCTGEVQGLLSQMLQLVRDMASSPTLINLGPSL